MRRYPDSKERGVALLTTLIAIAILTVLGLALTTNGRIAFMIGGNEADAIEAGYIAEAGLNHARELIVALNTTDYTSLLTSGDGTACNGDEFSTQATDPIAAAGEAFGNGQYTVSVCDDSSDGDGDTNADSNGVVRVVSLGTGSDNATATLELTLGTQDLPAVLVDGNLRLNSATTIMGTGGSVHSNGNLDLNGSDACAQLYFSTSGTIEDDPVGNTGAACDESGEGNMDARAGEAAVDVPTVDFDVLKANVDYILKDNGTIYQVSTMLTFGSPGACGCGSWSWSDPKWEIDGSMYGSYYAENTAIGINNVNSTSGTASFVADGYIEVSGNPENLSPDLVVDGVSYAMVAAYDLKINGNASTTNMEGVFFTNHQLDISGNPNINGQLIAADLADTTFPPDGNNLIPLSSGWMEFSGNPSITYSGGGGFGALLASGWREVRN